MKRTLTRMISAVCAAALGSGCMAIGADAKVIEPEIVKTESWTTSYYIDDDMDTLYPYIQCEADIYNDGTIKLYMWNTHEWGGSSPIKQNVTFCQYTRSTNAISDCDLDYYTYLFRGDGFYDGNCAHILDPEHEKENEAALKMDRNLHSPAYTLKMNNTLGAILGSNEQGHSPVVYLYFQNLWEQTTPTTQLIDFSSPSVAIALAKMKVYDHADSENLLATYTPISEVINTYNFRLFGHNITITPELLSGSITAEPKQTEQEQKIKALEEENAALKATLSAFDADADSLLTAADAQAVLNYYVAHLAGKTTGKVSDYAEYSKQKG